MKKIYLLIVFLCQPIPGLYASMSPEEFSAWASITPEEVREMQRISQYCKEIILNFEKGESSAEEEKETPKNPKSGNPFKEYTKEPHS